MSYFGQQEDRIIPEAFKQGFPIPDQILDAPKLNVISEPYYAAFWMGNRSRPVGMGLGPVPFDTWCVVWDRLAQETCGGEFTTFLSVMAGLDTEYMQIADQKAKASGKR